MIPKEAEALALARYLRLMLGELCELPQHGEGSCVEDARNRMDDVVELLEEDTPDEGPITGIPRLVLVKGSH